MGAWIEMIDESNASPALSEALTSATTPAGTVDNVMRVHSLRPHTMHGHLALYRSVLHNENNTLPLWFAETIASYVSILNQCDYSLSNHWSNAAFLISDPDKAKLIETALHQKKPETVFKGAELAMLQYAQKLTLQPQAMQKSDIEALKAEEVSDGDILEVNQVVGYFCYVNRLLNGLGVSLAGDVIGFYEKREQDENV